ncbi:hypothetical protein [Sulfurovum sp.]|uniref:hypothetical protein n=1 Tax=Sulfurovum sp. TaxID=1969726 RepID=UPI00356B41EA
MGFFSLFKRHKLHDVVTYDDIAVTRTRPDGIIETILWEDLHEVGILTTDEGPLQEDVFYLLLSKDGSNGCVIPQLSEGSDKLLERLQMLPEFDNETLIKAMGSTENARFVCWQRESA